MRGVAVQLQNFDVAYVERLRAGDPATQQHIFAYFGELMLLKLRSRFLPREAIEDIRQDTFLRVLTALRKEGGIQEPERLGSFVNSVCNNVTFEYHRASSRHVTLDEKEHDQPSAEIDMESALVTAEARHHVREVLDRLPAKDRDILRALFLKEHPKDEICKAFGIDRGYLRVLVHRAKERFREHYGVDRPVVAHRAAK